MRKFFGDNGFGHHFPLLLQGMVTFVFPGVVYEADRPEMMNATAKTLLLWAAFVTLLANGPALAQEVPNTPSAQQNTNESAQKSTSEIAPVNEEHERILFLIPAFGVTNVQNAPAMTAKHKFALAARQAFDPFVWASSGIQAGASQASNEFPEYGQGAAGFGKRYGAAMLDSVSGGLASTAFCVLLKQDPRYFRLGQGSIKDRIIYSAKQEFSTKSDKGTRQFNWSNVLGLLASASISNAYYPAPNRGFGLTMNRFAVGLLWGFTGEWADEFWPDIKRKLFHK
jgi:hypothetical protein